MPELSPWKHTKLESLVCVRPGSHLEQEVLLPACYPAPHSCEMCLHNNSSAVHSRGGVLPLIDKVNNKQADMQEDDTFIKHRRNCRFVICFLRLLRILCCSAGVTAIGGSKSRSILFWMLSISISPSCCTACWGFFSRFCEVCESLTTPAFTFPTTNWQVISCFQACQVDLWLSAGNCFSLFPRFSLVKISHWTLQKMMTQIAIAG